MKLIDLFFSIICESVNIDTIATISKQYLPSGKITKTPHVYSIIIDKSKNEYYCVNITPGRVIFGKYTRGANDNHEFPEFEKSNYFATEKGLIDLLIKIKKEIK